MLANIQLLSETSKDFEDYYSLRSQFATSKLQSTIARNTGRAGLFTCPIVRNAFYDNRTFLLIGQVNKPALPAFLADR